MREWIENLFDLIRSKWKISATFGLVVVCGVIILVGAVWPTPAPDVWDDGLDDVAGFFFDKDFNNLPVEERMEMLQEFVARFRDGGQEETAMLAMFLTDVTYDMRKQVEDNMIRLGVDMWSEWGREYEEQDPNLRAEYLDNLILEMDKLGDSFSGRESERSDQERLQGVRRQARRDQERAQEWTDNKPPDADAVTGFLGLYSTEVSSRASAQDRARIMKLSRDLTRHVRGEDVENPDG